MAGDRAALARLLSLVERGGEAARSVAASVFGRGSGAYTVGVTGAPGAGKSTLTNALLGQMRADGQRVGVLACDPSSPFTGGAILGDRIRMGDHALDPGVFIRSLATRGHLGGLALAVPEAVRLLDAVGMGWVIVETVGVGQVEVDVAAATDTTVVVVNPGWGDQVQANKAGLMEVADLFVINKADRPGAAQTAKSVRSMLAMTAGEGGWVPPVLTVTATSGEGITELWQALGEHRSHLEASGQLAQRRAERRRAELQSVLMARLRQRAAELLDDEADATEEAVAAGRLDPYEAADRLLAAE